MRYYELFSNMRMPERWTLADPVGKRSQEIDPWQFFEGRRLALNGALRLPLAVAGHPVDLSFTTLSIPVVNSRVAAILERLDIKQQVQLFPAEVEGQTEPYFILNALRVIRCIDDARCERVEYWKLEDGAPDKVGDYRLVRGLRIASAQVGDAHILRPKGWQGVLIISERLKQALEEAQVSGTRFTEV